MFGFRQRRGPYSSESSSLRSSGWAQRPGRSGDPPIRIADRLWEDFQSPPRGAAAGDLGARLFDFSSNGRVDTWRVALDEWQAHPAIGSGAGSYWQMWAAARPISLEVRDAHGLYFETLAESG